MKTFSIVISAFCVTAVGCAEGPGGTLDAGALPDGSAPDTSLAQDLGTQRDEGSGDDQGPPCVSGQVPAGAQTSPLCGLGVPVRHVRIEGLVATRTHASMQLFFGLPEPVGPRDALLPGQLKLQFYGGGAPQPPPDVAAYFGPDSVGFPGEDDFVNTASTVCMDLHAGSESTRALVVLWRDGEQGADCDDVATLTYATRFAHVWAEAVGALDLSQGLYFYQSGGTQTPVITLGDTPALAYDAVPPPECTLSPVSTSASERYVAQCALDAPVRHVRLTDVQVADPHGAVSVLLGYPAPEDTSVGPAAPTSTQQLRVQLYGGFQPHVGPQLAVHYEATSTTLADDAAFLNATSTLCFDIQDGSATTPPTLVLWRDGEGGADCEDWSTLTLETAFASVTDYGGVVGAPDKSLPLYLYQNTGGSTGAVTLFTRSALAL